MSAESQPPPARFDEAVLARQRRAALAVAVLAAVGFVVAALGAGNELIHVNQQITAGRDTLARVQSELDQASADLTSARAEEEALRRTSDALKAEVAELEARQEMLATVVSWVGAKAPAIQIAAVDRYLADHPGTAEQLGRVYLHVARPSQLASADTITKALAKLGFVVPSTEVVTDRSPVANQLRYFRDEDAASVEAVVAALEASGLHIEAIKARVPPGQRLPPVGQFEVWLGSGLRGPLAVEVAPGGRQ